MLISSRMILPVVLLMLAVSTSAVDPLDFLFSSNMAQFPRYRPMATRSVAVTPEFGKRAPPGCVCTEFLGCHGPGCMRRLYAKGV